MKKTFSKSVFIISLLCLLLGLGSFNALAAGTTQVISEPSLSSNAVGSAENEQYFYLLDNNVIKDDEQNVLSATIKIYAVAKDNIEAGAAGFISLEEKSHFYYVGNSISSSAFNTDAEGNLYLALTEVFDNTCNLVVYKLTAT